MTGRFLEENRLPFGIGAALALALGGVLAAVAGAGGVLYAVLFGLGCLPGLPAGFALFGRRHAAGWVAGLLLGYTLLALTLWAATSLGARSAIALVASWLIVLAISAALGSATRAPLVVLPSWRRRDTAALLLVLGLAPLLLLFPYRSLGASDAQGTRYYRAYFTADFLWHMALTTELAKYDKPPINPYLAPEPLHYYWTYFVVPAAVTEMGPSAAADVEVALKANATSTAMLFLAAIFVATWCAVPSATACVAAVALTVVAASAEGAYALVREIWIGGEPIASLRELNVDALSNWYFRGLRIDGLPRSMWYTPQHSMSVALGLLALPIAGVATASMSKGAIACAGTLLGASTLFNPLLGGMFSLIYGVVVMAAAVRDRALWLVVTHVIAIVPVLAAMGWCVANQMVEGAGTTLHFGVAAFARFQPVLTFCLSLGPVLALALAGLSSRHAFVQRLWPPLAGLAAGIGLLYFVVLIAETSYVGFRAGQIIQVSLAPLAAAFFARLLSAGRGLLVGAIAAIVFLVGAPTTVIDTWNAQDIGNLGPGPGFRWTITTTPDERAAFEFLRTRTRQAAVVQMDTIVRARETWTQIPAFAHRRMAAGLPISLINQPVYRERSNRVHEMYRTSDPGEASRLAFDLGIDFIYIDRIEREGLPAGFDRKFENSPALFRPVFSRGDVRVYGVIK